MNIRKEIERRSLDMRCRMSDEATDDSAFPCARWT
jgi:hypothetical protein